MDFRGLSFLSVLIACSLTEVSGHLCLDLDPVKDFDLAQFSGTWYAIQTTSPQSRCLVYNFKIQKNTKNVKNKDSFNCIRCKNCVDCYNCVDSEDLVGCYNLYNSKRCKGCYNGNNNIDCSVCYNLYDCKNVHNCMNPQNCKNIRGIDNARNIRKVVLVKHQFIEVLKADPRSPSKLSVSSTQTTTDDPEKTPFVVFTTDYQSYAGVYFCRKTANGQTHSVAILSRSQDLDKEKLNSLIEFIDRYEKGLKFSTVDHTACEHPFKAYNANRSVQNVIGDDEKVEMHISFMSTEDKPEIP